MTKTAAPTSPAMPDEALDQHSFVLGKTGSGKTYATKSAIVEPLLRRGDQVVIVDPTSAWWGLRSSPDGKKPGFPILIVGGPRGDLPISEFSGDAIARLATEQGVSVVVDTVELTVGERTRFFVDFATTLFRTVRAPLTLVLDEAHLFVPQGRVHDPLSGKMLHAGNTLFSGGRSRGIRVVGISQRPAKVHKDAITCAETLIAMRMIAPQDREAVEAWILGCGDAAKGKEVLASLAGLPKGEGWVWYPEGSVLRRVKFPAISTFDSSATPKAGERRATVSLADIDLSAIRASLDKATEAAEANDPAKLRAKLAAAERALEAAKTRSVEVGVDLSKKALDEMVETEVARRVEGIKGEIGRLAVAVRETVQKFLDASEGALRSIGPANDAVAALVSGIEKAGSGARAPRVESRSVFLADRSPAALPVRERPSGSDPILDALALWKAAGVEAPTRFQVAYMAGVSGESSTFERKLAHLRREGLIDYRDGSRLFATSAGEARATRPSGKLSISEVREAALRQLSEPRRRILAALIAAGAPLSRDAVGKAAGVSSESSTFERHLAAMRSAGLIVYPSGGTVGLSEIMERIR